MTVKSEHQKLIDDASRAMQIGPAAESEILSLFTEDAVWVEPYTGQRRSHEGKPAIQSALKQMWSQPTPPGFTITSDRTDVEGSDIKVEWTCSAAGMPTLMRGYSLYTITPQNKIARLELFITQAPGRTG